VLTNGTPPSVLTGTFDEAAAQFEAPTNRPDTDALGPAESADKADRGHPPGSSPAYPGGKYANAQSPQDARPRPRRHP